MKKKILAMLFVTAMLFKAGCSDNESSSKLTSETESITEEVIIDSMNNGIVIDEVSGNVYKTERNANPISGSIFCADPTAVEYEGRLYVYGTNDTEQAENDTVNDYDQIKSLVIFSTDDMVNWI